MEQKLNEAFVPHSLTLTNESHMHNVPPGSESHFRLVLVSGEFAGLSKVQRHRKVHQVLKKELAEDIHALALELYTPEEYQGPQSKSPPCRKK